METEIITLFETIRPRARVTIVNRFGQKLSGKAVMFNRAQGCWVLNMGGRYGIPGLASPDNVIAVKNKS